MCSPRRLATSRRRIGLLLVDLVKLIRENAPPDSRALPSDVVPVIEDAIRDSGQIRGARTREEAEDLAVNLRSGALPAAIEVAQERTVEASLGADSIRQGLEAGTAGLAAVVAAMLFYYRWAGANATGEGSRLSRIRSCAIPLSASRRAWSTPSTSKTSTRRRQNRVRASSRETIRPPRPRS